MASGVDHFGFVTRGALKRGYSSWQALVQGMEMLGWVPVGSAQVVMPRMPPGAMTRWSSWMQAVALWARSMNEQAKACVMLAEGTSRFESVMALMLVGMSGVHVMGIGHGKGPVIPWGGTVG